LLNDGVEPQRVEQTRPYRSSRQPKQRQIRTKRLPRMRLERQDQRRNILPARLFQGAPQNRLVSAMDTVEVANAHHATAKLHWKRSRGRDALDALDCYRLPQPRNDSHWCETVLVQEAGKTLRIGRQRVAIVGRVNAT